MADIAIKDVSENFARRFSSSPVCEADKENVMDLIIDISDKDETFENLVFELGCEMLADYYIKAVQE